MVMTTRSSSASKTPKSARRRRPRRSKSPAGRKKTQEKEKQQQCAPKKGAGAESVASASDARADGGGRLAWVAFWYAVTLAFNFTAVKLVAVAKQGALDAEDVTLLEMFACTVCGVLTLTSKGLALLPPKRYAAHVALLCAANLACCRLFIVAIQHLPLSLTQTVRSCQPLFTVAVCRVLWGQRYPARVYAAVALVSAGFAASAYGDAEFNAFGFACACASVTLLVFVNMRTKALLKSGGGGGPAARRAPPPDPLQVQAWTTSGSFALLLPMWALGGGAPRLGAGFASVGPSLVRILLADGFLYHLANVGTFRSIALFEPLTFAVVDTVRRLCVVASGFVYQGNPCSWVNVLGIALVFSGAGWYARLKSAEQQQAAKKAKKTTTKKTA